MADRRMVSSEIAEDVALNRASLEAQLFYLMTLPHLDRDGLITGIPQLLWARVIPLRVELMDKAGALVEEWATRGLVVRYPGGDGPVLFFPTFRAMNSNMDYGKEKPSRYPPPPGWVRSRQGLAPEDGETALRLAEQFKTGSHYYQVLMRVAGRGSADGEEEKRQSGGSRDHVGIKSRPGRDQAGSRSGRPPAQDQTEDQEEDQDQDQDQDQTEDQDQVGGGGGSEAYTSPGFLLNLVKEKRARAREIENLALTWMGGLGWKRRGAYVERLDGDQLALLVAWLWAHQIHQTDRLKYVGGFRGRSANLFAGVEKVVGFIRWNVAEGNEPELLNWEVDALGDALEEAMNPEEGMGEMGAIWEEGDE